MMNSPEKTNPVKKIVIAGGSGFIGSYLSQQFRNSGYNVVIVSRRHPGILWSDDSGIVDALENSEIVINLAGKSINCRFSKKNKNEILQSRIETTNLLGNALRECKHPPALWINASTASVYAEQSGRAATENDPTTRNSFLASVAREWEKVFFSFHLPHTRQAALRFGLAIGKRGPALEKLAQLTKLGLGGKQGSGNQMISWIHTEDIFKIILFLNLVKNISGVFNCTAPMPVTNRIFMKTLRNVMGMKVGIPAPSAFVKVGAFFMNTEPELVLESQWVIPDKLIKAGYHFRYPHLEEALTDILKDN